jgi:hypothetical protein
MSEEKTTFTFHSDPSHGWLEVDWTDLKRLGLNPTDFSRYSYRNGNTFYLEEDCDAPKFIAAYETKHGRNSFRFEEPFEESHFIRNLPCIHS